MNKTITTKKNAFEVNFFNKSIAGTKSAFNKASKGEGAHYEELTRLMAQHPDFRLVIKEQKIQKEKKETYEGLTFELMKEYISIQNNSKALMEAFEEVKKFAKEAKMSSYPVTKKWFLEQFEGFNVNKAKKAIYEVKSTAVVAKVRIKAVQTPANDNVISFTPASNQ